MPLQRILLFLRRSGLLALTVLGLVACGGGSDLFATSHTLSVTVNGSGRVTSPAGGLDCANSCSVQVADNAVVTLTAVPATGFALQAWGGACSGSAATCTLTIGAARSVTATFVSSSPAPRFTLGGTLSGLAAGARVVLRNNGSDDLTLAANGSFQFSQSVAQGASYSVGIATQPSGQTCSVANGSGTMQAAVSNVTVTCTSSSGGWQPPANLSALGASPPHVAMDDQGNGLAVWGQFDSPTTSTNSLWTSRYDGATGSWSAPVLLESLAGNAGYAAGEAHLAMHRATGRAVFTWLHTVNGTVNVWARDFDPSSGWGTATSLEAVDGMTGTPSAGVDASGNAMVAWTQMTPRWSIWASRFVRGTGWSAPQLLETHDTVGGLDIDPALAMSDNGQAMVAWKAALHNDAINGLWTVRFTPASGWGTAERRVASPAGGPLRSRPAVAADGQGRAVLAWGQIDVDASGIWHTAQTLRFDGSAWTATPAVVGVRQAVRNNVANPVLAMSPGGGAALVWVLAETGALQASLAPAGGSFGAGITLNASLPAGEVTSLPAVALNDAGAVMVGWRQGNTAGAGVYAQRSINGTAWSLDTLASDLTDTDKTWSFHAGLGLNASGQALAGWNVVTTSGTRTGTAVRVRRYVATP